MAGQYGVENLQKIIELLAEMGNVVEDVADAKSMIERITPVVSLSDEVLAMSNFDVAVFKQEYKELDAEDRGALIAAFEQKLDLSRDEIEHKIEVGLNLANQLVALGFQIYEFGKGLKASAK